MLIIITSINYLNKPLVWSYEPFDNSATLLYRWQDDFVLLDAQNVRADLVYQSIEGVSITDDCVKIDDMAPFCDAGLVNMEKQQGISFTPRSLLPCSSVSSCIERSSESETSLASVPENNKALQVHFIIPSLPIVEHNLVSTESDKKHRPTSPFTRFSSFIKTLPSPRKISPRDATLRTSPRDANPGTSPKSGSAIRSPRSEGSNQFKTAENSPRTGKEIPIPYSDNHGEPTSPRAGKSPKSPRFIKKKPKPTIASVFPVLTTELPASFSLPECSFITRTSSQLGLPVFYHPYHSILLDQLIPGPGKEGYDPNLWSDTLTAEAHFVGKTLDDYTKRSASCLQTVHSFLLRIEYQKNRELYPIQIRFIDDVRGMMNTLNVLYEQWLKNSNPSFEHAQSVFMYFRRGIYNLLKPYTPRAPKSKLMQFFHANDGVGEQIKLKLSPFLELGHSENKIKNLLKHKLCKDEGEASIIASFMAQLSMMQSYLGVKALLEDHMKHWSDYIISTSKILSQFKSVNLDIAEKCDDGARTIFEFRSFKSLLIDSLQEVVKQNGLSCTNEDIHSFATQTTKNIISKLATNSLIGMSPNKPLQFIASLSPTAHKDFYLCKEWKKEVSSLIKPSGELIPDDNTFADTVVDKIIKLLTDLLPTESEQQLAMASSSNDVHCEPSCSTDYRP